jgi:hypothetical protein
MCARCVIEIRRDPAIPGFKAPKRGVAELFEAEKSRNAEGNEEDERGKKVAREEQNEE